VKLSADSSLKMLPTVEKLYKKIINQLVKLEQNEDIEIFEKTISLSTKYFRDVYSFLNAILYNGHIFYNEIGKEDKKTIVNKYLEIEKWAEGHHVQLFRNLVISLISNEKPFHPAHDVEKIYKSENRLFSEIEDKYPNIRNVKDSHTRLITDKSKIKPEAEKLISLINELQTPLKIFDKYTVIVPGPTKIKDNNYEYIFTDISDEQKFRYFTKQNLQSDILYIGLKDDIKANQETDFIKLDPIIKYHENDIWFCIGKQHQNESDTINLNFNWQPFIDIKESNQSVEKRNTLPNKQDISKIQSTFCREVLLYDGFVGRDELFVELKANLNKKLFYFEGLGGIGKSFTAAKFYSEILSQNLECQSVWVDCHENLSASNLIGSVSKFLSLNGLEDFKSFVVHNEQVTNQFVKLLNDHKITIILDDFHNVTKNDENFKDDYLLLFKYFKEISIDSKIIVTSRVRIDPSISTEIGIQNLFQKHIRGLSISDFKSIIVNSQIINANDDLIEIVHTKIEGNPSLFELILSLIKSRTYTLEQIVSDDRFKDYEIPEIEEWLLSHIFSELNDIEKSIIEHLSLSRKDFNIHDATYFARAIDKKSNFKKTEKYIKHLVSKFVLNPASSTTWKAHQIVKDYCLGELEDSGKIERVHSKLGYNFIPHPFKKPKDKDISNNIDDFLNGIYHYYMSNQYKEAANYLNFIAEDARILGRVRDIVIIYETLKEVTKINDGTILACTWAQYWTSAKISDEFIHELKDLLERIPSSNKDLIDNCVELLKGVYTDDLQLNKADELESKYPHDSKVSTLLHNRVLTLCNNKQFDEALDYFNKNLTFYGKIMAKQYSPGIQYWFNQAYLMLYNQNLIELKNDELLRYYYLQYRLAEIRKDLGQMISSALRLIRKATEEELKQIENDNNCKGKFDLDKWTKKAELSGELSHLNLISIINSERMDRHDFDSLISENKRKQKLYKFSIYKPIRDKINHLEDKLELETLNYLKFRNENDSTEEFDFNLTTINKILDEARSLITNNNVSQLFFINMYQEIIDLYEYKNESIEELAKELCYSLLEIIFEVKNKIWLKTMIVYVIRNLILIGDSVTVNKAFEKTLNRDTVLIETVFKEIFINNETKDLPEMYVKNLNNFKNSDYYKNLSDILI
jgi:hypothetical protein